MTTWWWRWWWWRCRWRCYVKLSKDGDKKKAKWGLKLTKRGSRHDHAKISYKYNRESMVVTCHRTTSNFLLQQLAFLVHSVLASLRKNEIIGKMLLTCKCNKVIVSSSFSWVDCSGWCNIASVACSKHFLLNTWFWNSFPLFWKKIYGNCNFFVFFCVFLVFKEKWDSIVCGNTMESNVAFYVKT